MRLFRFIGLAGVALVATACMQVGFSAINLPSHFDNGRIIRDIAYGPESWQKLDVYFPPGAAGSKKDVVLFFYGGRWQSGDKKNYRFVSSAFTKNDFITIIPNYSKYPDVKFPVFVQDGAKALAWVYDHIGEYGGDKTRIHVAGHSAGAHIGALLATDTRYLSAEGKKRNEVIHDFAGLAGPYDFTPDENDLKAIFGPPETYPQMQATHFVDGSEPPMLLLYGDKDDSVKKYNLDRMITALKTHGDCYRSITYAGIDHVDIVLALSWVKDDKAPVLNDMVRFFRAKNCVD